MLSSEKKERIAFEVVKTLSSRFKSFPKDSTNNRNAPFHEAFLNAFQDKFDGNVSDIPFFISLSSWLHGLNTTLGQSFFENVAHILCDGEKKEFTRTRENLLTVTNQQKEAVANIITDLKNANQPPDLEREKNLIFISEGDEVDANNFTMDVFFEDDDKIVGIELKSVKPNAGEMRGEKQKILEAKSALFRHFSGKDIQFFIGFPFDPTSEQPTAYNKNRFLDSIIDGKKYFATSEVLLANELWDFLSGEENTMQQILDIINAIATTDFKEKYNLINDTDTNSATKKEILELWYMYSEIRLIDSESVILTKIASNNPLKRIYRQDIFKEGKYNEKRYQKLKELIIT